MNKKLTLLLIPIILSSFTHLWNPVGFPDLFFDEGIYMRRAMHVLETGNPQESGLYDHPFFGQILLASFLKLVNFPEILQPSHEESSIGMLYGIPRIFMGILAIIDTFLVYKIVEKKFGYRVAFVSSLLFAVMPMTWILRRILLDSLLLPFLLSSILFAMYSLKNKRQILYVVLSGITLGLAIFTKIPAFTMIPFVGYLVYTNTKSKKYFFAWLAIVILISSLWPLYSIFVNQFDLWQQGIIWQSQRNNSILGIFGFFFAIDPLLLILGSCGITFCIIRKNWFVILWFVPYVIFLSIFGFKQYFHWIIVLPVFCIAFSLLITEISKKFKMENQKIIISSVLIAIFGLTCTGLLIVNNFSQSQLAAISYVLENFGDDATILANPAYTWIFHNVFHLKNTPFDYSMVLYSPVNTTNVILIADNHFFVDIDRGKEIRDVFENTRPIKTFEGYVTSFDLGTYPYGIMTFKYGNNSSLALDGSLKLNYDSSIIEVRSGRIFDTSN